MILRNDIPESLFGVQFNRRFGMSFAFTFDKVKHKDLYFQLQPFLQILEADTDIVLFEFRIVVNLKCEKRIENEGFFELTHTFCLAAIDEFNRNLKGLKSNLTVNKSYTPVPTVEDIIVPVRQAYMMLNFNTRTSRN